MLKFYFASIISVRFMRKGERSGPGSIQKHVDPDPQHFFKNSSSLTLVRSTLSGRPRHSSWSSLFALLILICKHNTVLLTPSILGSSSIWLGRAKNYLHPGFLTVLGIRDIFVRIRIRGSIPLTNGSRSGSRSNSESNSFLQ